MLQPLTDKVAWVTGAGSGIGEAAAVALAREGVKVALSGRRREALEATAGKIGEAGGDSLVLPLDVRDEEAVQAAAAEIGRRYGRLDILFANAGINVPERRWNQISLAGWREVIDIDLTGTFTCIQAVLPMMREQQDGLIVNLVSWAGRHVSYTAGPAYASAKHAMMAMSTSLNIEEFRNGIRSCALCPAEVDTPIIDKRPRPDSPETRARMLKPDDIAETVLFLARMPPTVCFNEILVSPTYNRAYVALNRGPRPPAAAE